MKKETVDNKRYPHIVMILRKYNVNENSNDPFARTESNDYSLILHLSKGRDCSKTQPADSGDVEYIDKQVSIPLKLGYSTYIVPELASAAVQSALNLRTLSTQIPTESGVLVTYTGDLFPKSGDTIVVTRGGIVETGLIDDFTPGANNSLVHWKLIKN